LMSLRPASRDGVAGGIVTVPAPRGRSFVAFSLLCAACASAPPRPMPPAVAWTRGASVYVQPPEGDWMESDKKIVKSLTEEDLRAAGLQVLARSQNAGELDVAIGGLTWDGDNVTALVTARRAGEEIQSFSLPINPLPCFSSLRNTTRGNSQTILGCTSREIAARLIESPVVAAAMARPIAAPAVARPLPAGAMTGRLAVLELRNLAPDLTSQNAQYFTDVIRSSALRMQPGLEVMTRENLLVLLEATGKRLADCEGECEVDTGRRIGADQIVSGELQKLGSLYKLTIRLHETAAGRLRGSQVASGRSIEELDDAAQKASELLFSGR
jgi:hypothetical protein